MLTVRRHVYPHVSTHRVNLGVISYKLAHVNLAASAQQVCLHNKLLKCAICSKAIIVRLSDNTADTFFHDCACSSSQSDPTELDVNQVQFPGTGSCPA